MLIFRRDSEMGEDEDKNEDIADPVLIEAAKQYIDNNCKDGSNSKFYIRFFPTLEQQHEMLLKKDFWKFYLSTIVEGSRESCSLPIITNKCNLSTELLKEYFMFFHEKNNFEDFMFVFF